MGKSMVKWVEEAESSDGSRARVLVLGGVEKTGQQGFFEIDLEKLAGRYHPADPDAISVVATSAEIDRPARNAFLLVGVFKRNGGWPVLRFQSVHGATAVSDVRFSWQCFAPLRDE
jgi:hypothetical protein